MEYYPDKWILIEVKTEDGSFFKVLGSWAGGYLDGDHWRMNSGIVKVDYTDQRIEFYGESGSKYICSEQMYGATAYVSISVIPTLTSATNVEVILDQKEAMNRLKKSLKDHEEQ